MGAGALAVATTDGTLAAATDAAQSASNTILASLGLADDDAAATSDVSASSATATSAATLATASADSSTLATAAASAADDGVAAAADSTTSHTVETVSPDNVTIDVFDYWLDSDATNDLTATGTSSTLFTSGINADKYLKFFYNSALSGTINNSNAKVYSDMVSSTLEEGYPVLQKGLPWSSSTTYTEEEQSLAYLFDASDTTMSSARASYTDVSGLLQLSTDGYYYYDSTENFASLVDGTDSDGDGTNDTFAVYELPAVCANGGSGTITGMFFPFDSGSTVFEDMAADTLEADTSLTSTSTYTSDGTTYSLNHYFGVHLTSDFMQPSYTDSDNTTYVGKNSYGEEMTFSFSGDDDVWVYIDDVLVGDVGGVRSSASLDINFYTGAVTVTFSEDAGNPTTTTIYAMFAEAAGLTSTPTADSEGIYTVTYTVDGESTSVDFIDYDGDGTPDTFAAGTYHTLDMFYLERGNYDSNLSLYFNLVEVPESGLVKVDQDGNTLADADFVLVAATSDYELLAADGETTVSYDSDSDTIEYDEDTGTWYVSSDASKTALYVVADGTTDDDGEMAFALNGTSTNFTELYTDGFEYYVLIETEAPSGYRASTDGHLYYDSDNGYLLSANPYESGVLAMVGEVISAADVELKSADGDTITGTTTTESSTNNTGSVSSQSFSVSSWTSSGSGPNQSYTATVTTTVDLESSGTNSEASITSYSTSTSNVSVTGCTIELADDGTTATITWTLSYSGSTSSGPGNQNSSSSTPSSVTLSADYSYTNTTTATTTGNLKISDVVSDGDDATALYAVVLMYAADGNIYAVSGDNLTGFSYTWVGTWENATDEDGETTRTTTIDQTAVAGLSYASSGTDGYKQKVEYDVATGMYDVVFDELPGEVADYYGYSTSSSDYTYRVMFFYELTTTAEDGTEETNVTQLSATTADGYARTFYTTVYVTDFQNRYFVQKVDENGDAVDGATFAMFSQSEIYSLMVAMYGEDSEQAAAVYTLDNLVIDWSLVEVGVDEDGNYTLTCGDVTITSGQDRTTSSDVEGVNIDGVAVFEQTDVEQTDAVSYLVEVVAPAGYERSEDVVCIYSDLYGVHANAGTGEDSVRTMVGVGRVAKSLLSYVLPYVLTDNEGNTTTYSNTLTDLTLYKVLGSYSSTTDELEFDSANLEDGSSVNVTYDPDNALIEYAAMSDADTNGLWSDAGWTSTAIYQLYDYDDTTTTDTDMKEDLEGTDISMLFNHSVLVQVSDESTAGLTVTKEVTLGDESFTPDEDTQFEFTLALYDADDSTNAYTIGSEQEQASNENGLLIFTDADGTTYYYDAVTGAGTLFVGDTATEYESGFIVGTDADTGFTTITLSDGTELTAATTTLYYYTSTTGKVYFTATIVDADGETVADPAELTVNEDGTATFYLKDGQTIEFHGLEEGVGYTVTEVAVVVPASDEEDSEYAGDEDAEDEDDADGEASASLLTLAAEVASDAVDAAADAVSDVFDAVTAALGDNSNSGFSGGTSGSGSGSTDTDTDDTDDDADDGDDTDGDTDGGDADDDTTDDATGGVTIPEVHSDDHTHSVEVSLGSGWTLVNRYTYYDAATGTEGLSVYTTNGDTETGTDEDGNETTSYTSAARSISGEVTLAADETDPSDRLVFENEYVAAETTLADKAFTAQKTLVGRAFQAGDVFTFALTAVDGATMPEAAVTDDNGVEVVYLQLQVTEGADGTLVYTVYAVDADGNIIYTADEDGTETPVYSETLTLTTTTDEDGTTYYSLSAFGFGDIVYTTAGTFTYTIYEVEPDADDDGSLLGVDYSHAAYTVTVVVSDDGVGNLSVSSSTVTMTQTDDDTGSSTEQDVEDKNAVFTNSYTTATDTVSFLVYKDYTDESGITSLEAGMFTYTLEAVGGFANVSDLSNVDFSDSDIYTIAASAVPVSEDADDDGTDTDSNGADGRSRFTQISYELSKDAGTTYVYKLTENDSSASFFDGLTYDDAVYYLVVVNTSSTDEDGNTIIVSTAYYFKEVTTTSTDEETGETTTTTTYEQVEPGTNEAGIEVTYATFSNTYEVTDAASATITGQKTLDGITLTGDDAGFTFYLTAGDDATQSALDSGAIVLSSSLTSDDAAEDEGTTEDEDATEDDGADDEDSSSGIISSAIVAVTDDESDDAEDDGEDATTLTGVQKFSFEELTFTQGGTYTFYVYEDTSSLSNGEGYMYDYHVATVTIVVENVTNTNGQYTGALRISSITYDNSSSAVASDAANTSLAAFTNVYRAVDYDALGGFGIQKTLELADGSELTNSASSAFTFLIEALDYSTTDEDTGESTVVTSAQQAAALLNFDSSTTTDEETGESTTVYETEKTVTSDALTLSPSTTTTDEDGEESTTEAVTSASVTIDFAAILGQDADEDATLTFTQDDVGNVYTYKISEVDAGAVGYTYDSTYYLVTIAVTDEDGVLVVTTTVSHWQSVTVTDEETGEETTSEVEITDDGYPQVQVVTSSTTEDSSVAPAVASFANTYEEVVDEKTVTVGVTTTDEDGEETTTQEDADGQTVGVGDVLTYTINWTNDAVDAETGLPAAATVTVSDTVPTGTEYVKDSAAFVSITIDGVTYTLDFDALTATADADDAPSATLAKTTDESGATVEGSYTLTVGEGTDAITLTVSYTVADGGLSWTIADAPAGATGAVSYQAEVTEDALGTPDGSSYTISNSASVTVGENDPRTTTQVNSHVPSKTGEVTGNLYDDAADEDDTADEDNEDEDEADELEEGDLIEYTLAFTVDEGATSTTVTDPLAQGLQFYGDTYTGSSVVRVDGTDADGNATTSYYLIEYDESSSGYVVYTATATTDEETGEITYTKGEAVTGENAVLVFSVSDYDGDADTSQTLTWVLSGLSGGESVTITFTVAVTLDTLATVDNRASVDNHWSNTTTLPTDDDSHKYVTKETTTTDEDGNETTSDEDVDGEYVSVDDTLTYTVQWYNDGTGTSSTNDGVTTYTVTVTDTIPENVEYVADSITIDGVAVQDANAASDGRYSFTYDDDGNVTAITWTFTGVALGAKGVVTFDVLVVGGESTTIDNTAYVNNVSTETTHNYIGLKEQTNEELQEKSTGLEVGDVLVYNLSFTVPSDSDGTATVVDTLTQGLEYVADGSLIAVTTPAADEESEDTTAYYLVVYDESSAEYVIYSATYDESTDSYTTSESAIGESDALYGSTFTVTGDAEDGGQTLTWELEGLSAGDEVTISFSAQVTLASLVQVGNSYTVEGGESNTVYTPTDITSTKSVTDEDDEDVDGGQVSAGDTLTYTVQWVNTATDEDGEYTAASKIKITDTVPEGTTYVAGSAAFAGVTLGDWTENEDGTLSASYDDEDSGLTYTVTYDESAGTITWTIAPTTEGSDASIAAGAKGEVSFEVTVDGTDAEITNSATVYSDDSSVTTEGVTTYTPVKAVTSDDEDVDGGDVAVGDVLSYSITAVNDEDSAATMVITDTVPDGTVLVENSAALSFTYEDEDGTAYTGTYAYSEEADDGAGGYVLVIKDADGDAVEQSEDGTDAISAAYSESGGKLTWTVTNVPAGATVTASFSVEVTEDAVSYDSITNKASVQVGEDSSSSYTTGTTEVTPPSKTVSDADGEDAAGQTVAVGDELTYTIRWANDTGEDVSKVTVTDTVPTGTVLAVDDDGNYVISDGGSYDESTKTITWTIEPGEGESAIEAGATGTVSFTAVVTADAVSYNSITNTATVQVGSNGPSTSTTTTTNDVDKTRLVLSKTVLGGTSSNEDEQFEFTIALKDAEDNAISGTYAAVIVTPAANEDETATSEETTITFDEDGEATVKLAAGQSITIYSLPEGAAYTVTEVAASGYTTTAAVDGKATALTEVTTTDADGETTVTAYSVSGALTDADDATTATTVAFTNACTASKSVSVTSGEGDDATTTDDADGALVGVGDVLTYTISWVNDALDATTGEAVAAKVVITDTVPTGTVLVEDSAVFDTITGGSYTISDDGTTITDANGATVGTVSVSGRTITWTIDTAAAGASGTVSFKATVDSDALGEAEGDEYTISNSAKVQVGDDAPEQTLTVTNTVPKKEGEVVGNTETGTETDEQPDELKLGDIIEYTVSFTNADGEGATATVVDVLDEGLEYLEETTDETTGETTGGYTVTINGETASNENVTFTSEDGTLTWVLTNLPADATVVITFQVQVTLDSVANVVNSATVNGHSSNVITTPTDSDSHKMVTDEDGDSAEGELVGVGDTLTYTIQWYNDGAYETADGTAESSTVVITDTVPDGTVLVDGSVTINGNVADESEYTLTTNSDGTVTITWTFENVALGAKGEVGFTVTVTGEAGTISNTAYVNDSPTVDSSTTYVPVKEQTNEELQDAESLQVGDVLSYKLSFTVPESTDGTATVVDELAQGLEYLEGIVDGVQYGQETTVYVTDEDGTTTEQTATLVYSITSTTGADGTVTTTYQETEGSESTAWSSGDGIIYTFAVTGDADEGGQTLTWTFAGLEAGQSVVITFNAQVTLSSLVYVDNSFTVDGSESNTTTTPTSTASTKSVTDSDGYDVDGGQVSAGDTLTYTIQWVNATKDDDGEYVSADVIVKDTLPEGVELDEDSISGTEWTSDLTEDDLKDGTAYYEVSTDDDGNTVITWTIPNVAAGAKGEVSFTVTVTGDAATIANTAYVNDAETNTTTVYTPVKTVTDADGEDVDGEDVAVGDVLTYSITAVNDEDSAATMTITDDVPTGTVLVANSAAYSAVNAEGSVLTFDADACSISESNGTITWTFEDVPAGATITATFQVTVTEDALELDDGIENKATVKIGENEAEYSTGTTGTTVGTGSLTLSKTVVGTDDTSKEFTFTIILKGTDSAALTGTYSYTSGDETGTLDFSSGSATVSLKADERITIKGLPEDATYTITEAAVSGYTAYTTYDADDAANSIQSSSATGTVLAEGSTVAFTNVYSTSSVTSTALEVQKVVQSSDKTTTYAVGEGEYSFTLVNTQWPEGAAKIADQTVNTLKDGVAKFSAYTFSVAGTYVFTLSEANTTQAGITKDATVYTITYTVTDNGAGQLVVSDPTIVDSSTNSVSTITFTNIYDTTQVSYTISGQKAIDNTASSTQRTPKDGEFTFTLTEVDANGEVIEGGTSLTTTNGGSGFAFETITYSQAGTYYYQVSEAVPEGAVQNEDGSRTYNGLTYDTTVYTVVVTVAADANGVLSATANYETSGITFTNTYTPTSTTYGDDDDETELTVTKVLEGRDWAEGDAFSFTLAATEATAAAGGYSISDGGDSATVSYEAAEAETEAESETETETETESETESANLLQTLANAVMTLLGGEDEAVADEADEATATGETEEATASSDYTASFGTITFTKVGTYTFTVSEVIPAGATQNADGTYTLDGVTYDTSVKTITITVTDDGEGALSITSVSITDESGTSTDLTFTNTYEVQPTTAELTATKEVVSSSEATDYVLTQGAFSFTLSCVQAPAGAAAIADQKVENLENGLVAFNDLEFTVAGTYVFTLSENSSDEPGIEKDGTVYTITYTVTDDGKGNLVAGTPSIVATNAGSESTVNSIVFTNYYDTTQTSYAISGVKAIENTATTNRTAEDGEFTFVLTDAEGTVLQTVKNTGSAFSFSAIDYTEAGTYTYKVYEQAGNDSTIEYDDIVYEVTVFVTETDGKLVATANYETSEIVFTNTYTPTSTTAVVQATKVLNGRTLSAGEFSFELTDGTNTYTATNAADGSVTFEELSFTDVGTYTYTLSEVVPDDDEQLGGVTYDKTTYTVTITVTENDDTHALEASVAYAADGVAADEATFTNAYEAEEVTAVINGTKTFDGYGLSGGEFTFVLVDESGDVIGTVENTADGSFAFDELTFSEAGTYVYTVQERYTSDIEGVSYDKTVYTVTYEVTDTGSGALTYTRSITSSEGSAASIDFVNPYNPDAITVSVGGTKHIESDSGRTAADGEFTFQLTEVDEDGNEVEGGITTTTTNTGSGFTFANVATFTEPGTSYFRITEVAGSDATFTYSTESYIVKVVVTGTDALSAAYTIYDAEGAEVSEISFTNVYAPTPATLDGAGNLTVTKTLTGRDWLDGEVYAFTLAAGDDATEAAIADGTVTLPDATTLSIEGSEAGKGYSESFGDITFAEAGTYTFTVSEVIPADATAGNGYTSNGVTFDTSVKTITVTVADDGSGQLVATLADGGDELSFENSYEPEPATDTLTATKVIGGGYAMSGGEFTFVLADADGNVVATADNASDGDIVFDELTFAEAGTYTYTLIERYTNTPGVSFDRTVYTITYTVTDDGHGSLVAERSVSSTSEDDVSSIVFTNPYDPEAITVSIAGLKYLTGDSSRSIADGEFTFALTEVDEDGNVVEDGITATTVNTGNGFTFEDVATFTEPGVKYFKITEVAGSDSTITYDDTSYTVKVEVTGTDVLTATYSLDTADIVFTNVYTPEEEEPEPDIEYTPVSVKISGTKTLSGKTLAAGDFTFVLADEDGSTVSTTINKTNGSFIFNALTFTEAGTYTYTVSESIPSAANALTNYTYHKVTYDTSVYTVVINVGEDASSGSLVASVSYLKNGAAASSIVFANTYTPASISVTPLAVTKVLEGRDLQEGEFSFTATVTNSSTGKVVATVQGTNAADGTVSFPKVSLNAAGTYTVTVTEDVPEDADGSFLTYDTHTYTYEIVVTYSSSSGAYSASIVEGDESGGSTFTNVYDVPEDTKTVTDADGDDVDGSLVSVGDELVYTICWVNDAVDESGANVAATVVVTDTLPVGTVLVDGSITGDGVYDEDTRTITWTIEAAACETGSVSFAVEVDDTARTSDEIENTAHVQVGGNEHAQATNSTTVYVPVKTVTDAQNTQEALVEALVGQELTYTIAYRNAGAEAQAMTITDVVPTGTVLVEGSISDGGVYDAETNTITWYFASVEPSGEAQYVSFDVTVTEDAVDTTIENQASIQLGENDPVVVTNTTEVTVPSAALTVSKTVAGALADTGKEFTFTVSLADASGTALTGEYAFTGTSDGTTEYSGTIGDSGTLVLSDGGSVTIEGLPAGTQFSVVEEEAAGYTAEPADGTVTGTLVADETAQAAFTNTYDATGEIGEDADVAIVATKTLSGRSLKAGEFTFQIADTAGNVVSTGTNAADGTIAFSTISYTAESLAAMVQAGTASVDGNTYTIQYIASEVTDALPDGVSAESASFSFTVTLVDDGEGNLVASVRYPDQGDASLGADQGDGSLAFVNSYEAEDVEVSLAGVKVLALEDDGLSATLADIAGAFTFTLTGSEGAPLPDETTATNDEAGNISFGTVTIDESCLEGVEFAEDGTRSVTFTYTVAESGSYAGVTNDAGEQTFTVTVTQDADGTITVATSAEDGTLFTFTNTYGADAASVVLAAGKVLDGAELASGQFTFQLLDADGNVLQTVTNDADGAITFDAIEYTQVGTYTYTIVEVDDGQEGVTYDTTVHTATVTVTDDGEGQLVASVSYDGAESSPSFVNSYEDDGDEPDDGDDGGDDEPDEPDDGDDGGDDEPDEPDDGGSDDGDDGSSDDADDDDSGDDGDESDDGDADADADGDTGGSASKTGDAGFGTSLLALLMALLAAGGAVSARRMRKCL